jgi:hypothetical protein
MSRRQPGGHVHRAGYPGIRIMETVRCLDHETSSGMTDRLGAAGPQGSEELNWHDETD